jgi:hypothetical protein
MTKNNRSKIKGDKFERDAAKMLSENGAIFKRVPGSGSIGTNLGMASLTGDLQGHYPWFRRDFRLEAKVGYGTSKQMTLKREWFTKIRDQAALDNKYPAVVIKFNDVTGGDIGSATAICFNLDVWNQLMSDIKELNDEYTVLLEKYYGKEKENAE